MRIKIVNSAEFAAGAPWTVFETQRRGALANAVKRSVQTASRLTAVLERPWTDPPEPGMLRGQQAALGIAIAELRAAEGLLQALIASQTPVQETGATQQAPVFPEPHPPAAGTWSCRGA